MSDRQQGKLFPRISEKDKIEKSRTSRMTMAQFRRLWHQGYDPAYLLNVADDDIPTLATIKRIEEVNSVTMGKTTAPKGFIVVEDKAVVLSRSIEDPQRRIVARSENGGPGGWVFDLWVAVLHRQVRDARDRVKGICYGIITQLECDPFWQFKVDRVSQDLLSKRRF